MRYLNAEIINELEKLIEKWDEQIALHRRVCDDTLMYTKEDRLKNSHYAQAICAVVADLKKLTIPAVGWQSEQLTCPRCKSTNILNPDKDNDAQCIECAFVWTG